MGRWDYYYPPYVPVAEKKRMAQEKLKKLMKTNPNMKPVTICGRKIATTWWGRSWNMNLERYADYTNRIGRGRSYVRNGMVLDLQIESGNVTALVQGTDSRSYEIVIKIARIAHDVWGKVKSACHGKIESLAELLEGKFPEALENIFMEKGRGLFPSPQEIKFSCSCPDRAHMCKHVAAVLYGIGARLDHDPLMFFKLRNVSVNDMVTEVVKDKTKILLEKAGKKTGRVMKDDDIARIFGIELEDEIMPAAKRLRKPEKPEKSGKKERESGKKLQEKKLPVPKKRARKAKAAKEEAPGKNRDKKKTVKETQAKKDKP